MEKSSINEEDETITPYITDSKHVKPNLKGDWLNFLLLIVLYTVQGLPYGLSMALPIIFQSKKVVSYEEQAVFSFVFWPYTIKLFWAPIVDTLYIQWMGRRKSWIIPVQFITGAFLLYMAINIDVWLPETKKPNITVLTYVFFFINFLSALQDTVVDGWALTILKKNNVSYASTANWTGFTFGQFIGFVSPVLLTSERFCNAYLRITPSSGGMITLKNFFYFWGIVIILITALVGLFKKEKDNRLEDNYIKISVLQNYKLLWDILKLPSIRTLAVVMLTMRIGISATHALSNLKLMDVGVSKEDITMISTIASAVQIVVPLIISKYSAGPKPMNVLLKMIFIKLLWCLTHVVLIYYTPMMLTKINGVVIVPKYYYFLLGFIVLISETLALTLLVIVVAFFSRISDPRFGSTYMTLLSTITSLGWFASTTLALRIVDNLTFEKCSVGVQNSCSTPDLKSKCITSGGSCITIVDGYYVEVALCLFIGFIWYIFFRNTLKKFQTKNSSYWLASVVQKNIENDKETFFVT